MSATRSSRPIISDTSRLPADAGDGLAGGGDLAVTQHRHAVAEREHLLELVADEDDGDALRPQPAQDVE